MTGSGWLVGENHFGHSGNTISGWPRNATTLIDLIDSTRGWVAGPTLINVSSNNVSSSLAKVEALMGRD